MSAGCRVVEPGRRNVANSSLALLSAKSKFAGVLEACISDRNELNGRRYVLPDEPLILDIEP